MASHYGIVFPEFWTGPTGRAIHRAGGRDAQIVALYLMTCRSATMLGLFQLTFNTLRHETHLGDRKLVRALEVLGSPTVAFANYDPTSEVVWVREMAKFRLSLGKKPLDRDDKRAIGCQRLYDELVENPFLGRFFDRYHTDLKLKRRREDVGIVDGPNDHPHGSPLQGASKGLGSQRSDQISRSEISRSVDQGIRKSTRARARGLPVENADADHVLVALVHREVAAAVDEGDDLDPGNLHERVKVAAARAHLAYDGPRADVLRDALDVAHRRMMRVSVRRARDCA